LLPGKLLQEKFIPGEGMKKYLSPLMGLTIACCGIIIPVRLPV
jgi:hypothetical protein